MAGDDVVDVSEVLERWREEEELLEGLRPAPAAGDGEWVSLAAAESAAGVSRSTLRAWFRTGQLRSRLTPGPHGMQRLVPLTDVLARASKSPKATRAEPEEAQPVVSPSAGASSDVVRLAELAMSEARARAEQAEERAARAEAALGAAIERAAAAEAELRLLRGQPPAPLSARTDPSTRP